MALHILTGSCPRTRAEAREELADDIEREVRPVAALHLRMLARRMRRQGEDGPMPELGTVFLHGPADPAAVCPCGHLAEYLCDEPLGRGRTCDGPMCRCCRTPIGEELDRCRFHAAAAARPVP